MAIKYLCDGCDQEVPYDLVRNVSVRVETKGLGIKISTDYELCKPCEARLTGQANPKNWVRAANVSNLVHDQNSASGFRVA